MDTQFIGEHLRPGQLGHFFAIVSFVATLFSVFSYFRAVKTENAFISSSNKWLLLGRSGFIIHAAALLGIFITLFYIISNHLFEYHYAWEHSSRDLPAKYLLSCFWEGQEGSFMLWTFWHSILGLIVMATSKGLETRVMTIIAFVQLCLATMVLGIYLGPEIRLGSTPFILLRHSMQGAPIFAMPNYLDFVKDGNGLNVLLQNYWMVIHPPILFLGFASTLIPFSYSIAALWKGEYQSFIKPTLVWSLFGCAVLGTGIMMGGAWAYESLNFGGYWAWDPVENASLVPWLTFIAGLHTLIIYKSTQRSLPATFILLILTQLLIWYSTFLTRTGVLSKTSVHAFTGEGGFLYWHLLIVIAALLIIAKSVLIWRWKTLPRIKTEEEMATREFWMFIGAIVLLLSAIQIIFLTSLPIWAPLGQWITGKEIAPPVEPIKQYNSVQVWVAIVIGLLSGTGLYLKFKHTDTKTLWRRLGVVATIALILSLIIGFSQHIDAWQYTLMLFAACFGIVAAAYYAITVQKGKLKKLGASTGHFGFALALLGILLSSYNKEVISFNTFGVDLGLARNKPSDNAKENRENILLYRDAPVVMGDYLVTYKGDTAFPMDARTFYKVDYERRDSATQKITEQFSLYPTAFENPKGQKGSLIANPASKHYITKDIFTFVTSRQPKGDTGFESHTLHKGDSVFLDKGYLVFEGFSTTIEDIRYDAQSGDIAVNATLSFHSNDSPVYHLSPIYYIRDKYENHIDDTLASMGIYIRFSKVLPEQNAAEIMVKQSKRNDYITLKAMVFPYINVLWLGIIIMVLGFLLSMWNRLTKKG